MAGEAQVQALEIQKQQWEAFVAELTGQEVESNAEWRRTERRHYLVGSATISVTEKDETRTDWAPIINVSNGGATVRYRRELKPGAPVDVQLNISGQAFRVAGTVAHCTETLGGYKTGIRFEFDDDQHAAH